MLEIVYFFVRIWHVIGKMFAFFMFGLGGVVIAATLFPIFTILLLSDKNKLEKFLRRTIQRSFRLHTLLMQGLGLISVKIDDMKALKSSRGSIVCANHPTLIDVVVIIGLLNDPDCIVKSSLWNNPFVRGIVRRIYISNALSPEETFKACQESLKRGNNLVIFPEGTRTAKNADPIFRRSAAQFAIRTNHPILPLNIATEDCTGLGKGDKIFEAPHTGVIHLKIKTLAPLDPAPYLSMDPAQGSRALTKDLFNRILSKG